MPNKFKYNKTGTETDSLFKGNWSIDTSPRNSGGGPSSTTGLYHGAPIPSGGYTIYSPGSVYTATTDEDLLGKVRDLGGDWSSVSAALTWASIEPTVMILNKVFDNIVTDGLVFKLDASNVSSFTDNQPTINYLADGLSSYNVVQRADWNGANTQFVSTSEFNTPIRSYNTVGTSYLYSHDYVLDDDRTTLSEQTVTFSLYIRRVEGAATGRIRTYDNVTGYTYYPISVTSNFQRFEMTKTIGINPERIFVMLDNSGGGTYEFHSPQLEIGSSATPFVDGIRLQNSWYDLSGHNYTATKYGNPTFNTNGYWEFRNENGDGDYEYFKATFNEGVIKGSNATGAWTIETIFRDMGSAYGGENIIIGRGGHHSGILQKTAGGEVYAQLRTNAGGAGQAYINGGTTTDGIWNHAVMTYNNRVTKFYLNGVLMGTHTMDGAYTPFAHGDDLYIGGYPNNAYRSYTDISLVKAYTKELSQDEVTRNYYSANLVNTNSPIFVIDPANLKALDESLTVIKDIVNANDFTIEGVGSKITDNNGVLSLNAGRIYAPTTGWFGKMATSWWMRWTGPKAAGTFYTESYRGSGGCSRISSYMNGNGTFRFSVWDNSSYSDPNLNGSISVTTTTDVCDGNWHHITCQWSNGSGNIDRGMYVYVNGILESSADAIGNDGGYQHMHLGGVSGCVGEVTSTVDFGPIVQYKNYNLSHGEVYQNYTAYAARFK